MRRVAPLLVLLLPFIAGCAFFQPVAPGSDPAVVRAEQANQAAFETITTFLRVEKENQPFVKEKLPDVHALAEQIRNRQQPGGKFPPTEETWEAIAVYKVTRLPSDEQVMKTKLETVSALARQARLALVQIRSATS